MAKTIIKEIIIMLLLCLAILVVLGILLYDYVPMTKTIPNPVSYTTPDNVKKELADAVGVDESQIIMTYEVDSTDLNNYKKTQDYKPGKANPFSSYETSENTEEKDNTTEKTSTKDKNNTTTTNNTQKKDDDTEEENITKDDNATSGGKFFQNKGTK